MKPRRIAYLLVLSTACIEPGTSVEWPAEFDPGDVAFLLSARGGIGSLEFEGPFTVDQAVTRGFDSQEDVALLLVSIESLARVAPRFDGVAAEIRAHRATPDSLDVVCRDEGVASDDGLRIERALEALEPVGVTRLYRLDASGAFVEEDSAPTDLSISYRVRPCLDGRRPQVRSFFGEDADPGPLDIWRIRYLDDETIVVLTRTDLAIWKFGAQTALQRFDLSSLFLPVPKDDRWLTGDFAVDASGWPGRSARVLVTMNLHELFEADGQGRLGHRESRVLEFSVAEDAIELSTTRSMERLETLAEDAEGRLEAIVWLDDGGYLAVGRQRVESATSAMGAPVAFDLPGLNARVLHRNDDPREPFLIGDDGPVVGFGDPRLGAEGIRTELVTRFLRGGVDSIARSPTTNVLYAGTSAGRLSRRMGFEEWTEIPYRAGPEARACFEDRRCGRYEPVGAQGTLPIRALGVIERPGDTLLVSQLIQCSAIFITSSAEQCSYAEPFVGDSAEYITGGPTPGLFDLTRKGANAVLLGGHPGYVLEVGDNLD